MDCPKSLPPHRTSVCTLPAVSERFIHFYKHGSEGYDLFRNERFVVKTRKLSDTIKKVNLPLFIEIPTAEKKQQNSDALVKELSNVQKNIDIARGRGITLSEILQHDLLATNVLFSDDITSKPEKHMLVNELEKLFDANELSFTKASHLETALAVDFMSMVRRMKFTEMSVFLDLFSATWRKVKGICDYQRIDVVFDSYVERSLKDCERKRRSSLHPLEYTSLENDTRIPVQSDRFWASSNNKEKLQILSRLYS